LKDDPGADFDAVLRRESAAFSAAGGGQDDLYADFDL